MLDAGPSSGEHASMLSADALGRMIDTGEIDTVVVAFPDLQGRPVGKRVTAAHYLDHVTVHGIDACDYLLAVDLDMTPLPGYRFAGWDQGYGDLVAVPDPTTLRLLPWVDGTAFVLCDLVDRDGAPIAVSPRQVLRAQIARAAEQGLEVRAATELEFYLFRTSPGEAAARGWRSLEPASRTIQDYQLLETAGHEDVLRQVRNDLLLAGVPVECSKGEAGRGQVEVNVTFGGALEAADRHLVLKQAVKEIAARHGRAVTFMAKWSMDEVGSSCHLHTSLWDEESGRPLMAPASPGEAGSADGLSAVGRRWLGGQLAAAGELAWCSAPTVNSYKRYVPGSWAPTAVVWGEDNRTCGFRAVGHGAGRRIESRVPGADVNPYLALAAAIAGGLWGIEHDLDPGPPFAGNGYEADVARLPTTLVEAVESFEGSRIAPAAFGEDVHHHLANTARQEWLAANRAVTDWELARYFERI